MVNKSDNDPGLVKINILPEKDLFPVTENYFNTIIKEVETKLKIELTSWCLFS